MTSFLPLFTIYLVRGEKEHITDNIPYMCISLAAYFLYLDIRSSAAFSFLVSPSISSKFVRIILLYDNVRHSNVRSRNWTCHVPPRSVIDEPNARAFLSCCLLMRHWSSTGFSATSIDLPVSCFPNRIIATSVG